MALKLKPSASPAPISFEKVTAETSPTATPPPANPPPPPTCWISARDMHIYGSAPLRNTSDLGVVQCSHCLRPVLRTVMAEHAATCSAIRSGKKGVKSKIDEAAKGKKRKAEDVEPDDAPKTKKAKAATNPKAPPKARIKGPIDLDRHCGVINVDKNLPCSRSLTCKSHSMGAKRAVQGRSKDYDVLLLEWNRAHNPNFVEPVKKESKKERKEKKEAEKRERKQRELEDFARKKGIDLSQPGAEAQLEQLKAQTKKKKAPANTERAAGGATGSAAVRRVPDDPAQENLAELDSEEELEAMVKSVHAVSDKGLLGAPLAAPSDVGSWFVVRRERMRNCKDLFASALLKTGSSSVAGSASRLSISGP